MSFSWEKNTFKDVFKEIKSKKEATIKQGMQFTMESARSGVADRTPRISGRLVGSIQGKGYGASDTVNRISPKKGGIVGEVGSKVEYANKVEFTSKDNKGFFKRGFAAQKDEMIAILKNMYKKLFEV